MFPHWPSPVVAKDRVYLARHDGSLYALEMSYVDRCVWSLYLGNHKRDPLKGPPNTMRGLENPLWEPKEGLPIYATPAIAKDGAIVIGSGEGWLYCIREK